MAHAPIRKRLDQLMPWAGLLGGTIGALGQHQTMSNLIYERCELGNPLLMGLSGLIAAAVVVAGGLLSLAILRSSVADATTPDQGSRRFIAGVSAMSAGIFLLVVIAQTLAGFIIPDCYL